MDPVWLKRKVQRPAFWSEHLQKTMGIGNASYEGWTVVVCYVGKEGGFFICSCKLGVVYFLTSPGFLLFC